ncbi:MAG TPA: thiamine-phosphate kinase [Actinomycetota bacterium]
MENRAGRMEIGIPSPLGGARGGTVAGFTEDELLTTLRRLLSEETPGVRVGPGDDAAVVDMGWQSAVLTADMLVEGVHFDRSTISARDLGYKAVVVNVSDVAAMGGSPRYGLVSLGLPPDADVAWVVELYGGIRDAAAEYAMSVVGGDTARADRVVVAVAITGEVPKDAAVTRAGARPGDRIVVTGSLGAAAGGLHLSRAPASEMGSALTSAWGRDLLAAQFRPVARVGEGQTLAQRGATAMMDISDGLSLDLSRLCRESGVAATIHLADIPVAAGLSDIVDIVHAQPLDLALSGGEDYELLATLPAPAVSRAREQLGERFGTALTDIGEIREGEGLVAVDAEGTERPLEPKGWDHFAG